MKTADELLDRAEVIANTLAQIKNQIAEAKSKARTNGERVDDEWLTKAGVALRMKGAEHQRLLRRIATARKKEREAKGATFGKRFIDEARRVLDAHTYRAIMTAAHQDEEAAK